MFSTASSSTAGGSKVISTALRKAGLMDSDTQMRDVNDKPGGRKGSSKIRSHRNRPIDAFKAEGPGPNSRLSTRLSSSAAHAGPSDPLAIRGASRPTVAGRLRRNAVSAGVPNTLVGGPRIVVAKPKAVESWREVVRKRWNADNQFLNLESLIDDELVKKYNLNPPGTGGGSAREAAVIFKLASELKPPVKSLSLANNKLNGEHLQYLPKYLPKLENLSLQNNNLRQWKDIDYISGRREKLPNLKELILIENPIRDMEIAQNRAERYMHELARRFNCLELLDSQPVTKIGFDAPQGKPAAPVPKPSATSFPFEMKGSFVTGVPVELVSEFLVKFFGLFDNQRTSLVDAYDPNARFSYAVNTSIPARARIQAFQHSMPNQKKLEWSPWLSGGDGGSRNLSRIAGGLQKTVDSLHIGPDAIIKAVQGLPGTRHNILGPAEKFCLDAFPMPVGQGMGLLVTVHGEFTEVGAEGIRSFDRTFVLAPAADGSRSKANGWPIVVLSDQWIVRIYSSHEAWKPGPLLVQAVPKPPPAARSSSTQQPHRQLQASLSADQQAALNAIPDPQRGAVLEVISRTNLNVRFALDCLQGNEWNLDRAIANFNQVKGQLGREAYL